MAVLRSFGVAALALLAVGLVFGSGLQLLTIHAEVTPVEATTGEVLSAGVDEEYREDAGARGGGSYVFTPQVDYRYTVDGETYSNDDVVRPGRPTYGGLAPAQTFASRFEGSDPVTVYYHPDYPERSYLYASYPLSTMLTYTVGWTLLLVLVALDVYGLASAVADRLEGLPAVGDRTPIGMSGSLPLYGFCWYLALVPWSWQFARGRVGGFDWVVVALAVGSTFVWVAIQASDLTLNEAVERVRGEFETNRDGY